MAHRFWEGVRLAAQPIDRMASYQGEEILKTYKHGEYSFDESTGLLWMVENESPRHFLARMLKLGGDEVIVIERTEGYIRCYKYGEDQSHPIILGVGSPEFELLERKVRYPELLAKPYLWKKLA